MEIDQMTNAELDARFEAAFAAVHKQPPIIDAYPPTVSQRLSDKPYLFQVFVRMLAGFVGTLACIAIGVIYFVLLDIAKR